MEIRIEENRDRARPGFTVFLGNWSTGTTYKTHEGALRVAKVIAQESTEHFTLVQTAEIDT